MQETPSLVGPPRVTAIVAAIAMGFVGLTDLLTAAAGAGSLVLPPDAGDILVGLAALLFLFAFVGAIVTFCLWFYRAVRFAHTLTKIDAPGPGWAVGSFFVPFANLVIPYRAAAFTAQATARAEGRSEGMLVGAWWGFWIASNVASQISFRIQMQADTLDMLQAVAVLDIVAGLLGGLAAGLCVWMITSISGAQQRIAAAAQPQFSAAALHPS